MSEPSSNESEREDRLDEILAEYLQAVETGQTPDRQEFLARHPEFAAELEEYFADKQQFDRLAGPFAAPAGPTPKPPGICDGPSGNSAQHPTIAAGQSPTPPPGTTIRYFGDYELLEEIARGGMGVVYKARQVSLNRVVALKMILGGQVASEADVQRFHTEAEAAANLDHPGIVPIYEVGQHQGQHYFSMGYVEGQSLAGRLADGPLPARDAAELAAKVSQAVAYAHQQGVIHRDLKPSNVLLARRDRIQAVSSYDSPDESGHYEPKLTDFGLAKRVEGDSDLTATGQVLGTPSYMPPEQAAGKLGQVKQTADVYSLGAILYALLTGRPPFQADNPLDTLTQVLDQEPLSPRLLNPKLPRDLETICLKCLEKEPHRRYAGAAELAEDLQRFLDDEPIRARPIGNAERLRRWFGKQHRSVALTAAAAAITTVVMVAGLLGWYGYRQWQLGYASFATASADSPYLVAEVLDENDRAVTGPFTVPTQEKMPLTSDSYRLRVSASGRLSETFRFFLPRSGQEQYTLSLDHSQLWPTLPVPRCYALAKLDGRTDVILLDETGFSRLDGVTCQALWAVDLAAADHGVESGAAGFRWDWSTGGSPSGRGKFDQRPMLVDPAPDLDGDGVGDLVFAARHQAWLLAYSGKQGRFLWVAGRGRSVLREPNKDGRRPWGSTGTVVATPAAVDDLDDDGTPDLLVTFADIDPAQVDRGGQLTPRRWVEAVSGRTGKPLWRLDLPDRHFQLPAGVETPYDFRWFLGSMGGKSGTSGGSGSRGLFRYRQGRQSRRTGNDVYVPDATTVVRSNGQTLAVAVAGTHVVGVDLVTGKPAFKPHDLGFAPARAARPANLDGDEAPELLLIDQPQVPQGTAKPRATRLVAWSLAERKELWSKRIAAEWGMYDLWYCPPPQWPLAADLDGDGRSEVIVPDGSSIGQGWAKTGPWGGLAVFDGPTGRRRWQRRLITMDQQVDRFTVGADVDGDGCREIFAATFSGRDYELFVDALSGKDGRSLWWARQQLGSEAESIGLLRWWQTGADGWPQLFVSIEADPSRARQQGSLGPFVFSAGTGRLARVGRDIEDPRFGDGDGDGLLDLYTFRADDPYLGDRGGKLDAVRGLRCDAWRHLGGEWIAATDFNGDGFADLLSRPRPAWRRMQLAAVSGRSGKILWHANTKSMTSDAGATVIKDDLDDDGVRDVLVYDDQPGSSAGTRSEWPLQAISGHTGKRLWSADTSTHATRGSLLAESRDLDGDGHAEIVYAAANDWAYPAGRRGYGTGQIDLWLAVFSGRTGETLWKQPLSRSVGSGRGIHYDVDFRLVRPAYGDLDADGTVDIVLPAEATPQGDRLELRAFSGVNGEVLWRAALAPAISPNRLLLEAPLPVIGDIDGDGKLDVVVLEYLDTQAKDWRDRYHARLRVLAGTDGKPKGPSWETRAEPLSRVLAGRDPRTQNRPAPLLLARAESERMAVAVGLWGSPGEAVVWEPDGREIMRFPLIGAKANEGFRAEAWDGNLWGADLNADGTDELIVASDGKVLALQPGAETPLWQWRTPTDSARAEIDKLRGRPDRVFNRQTLAFSDVKILDLLPGVADGAPTVAARCGNGVYGLSGTDGRLLWTSLGGSHRIGQSWKVPTVSLMTVETGGPPRVISGFPDEVTVCRQAIATEQDLRHTVARAAPRIVPLEDDPRLVRPLPWVDQMSEDEWIQVTTTILYAALLSVVVVALPGALLWRMVRRRRWSLRTMLVLPVVVAMVVTVLTADLPLAPRDVVTVGEKLGLALMVLPGVVFAALVIRNTFTGRWWSLICWMATSVAAAALLAGVMLAASGWNPSLSAGEHYSLSGWYLIWVWGAYATGILAIVGLPGRMLVNLFVRQIRRPAAKPNPA